MGPLHGHRGHASICGCADAPGGPRGPIQPPTIDRFTHSHSPSSVAVVDLTSPLTKHTLYNKRNMAGTADAAKNAFSSFLEKGKEMATAAADTTKGLASQAQQAIGKVIPGMSVDQSGQDPTAVQPGAPGAVGVTDPHAGAPPPMQ